MGEIDAKYRNTTINKLFMQNKFGELIAVSFAVTEDGRITSINFGNPNYRKTSAIRPTVHLKSGTQIQKVDGVWKIQ